MCSPRAPTPKTFLTDPPAYLHAWVWCCCRLLVAASRTAASPVRTAAAAGANLLLEPAAAAARTGRESRPVSASKMLEAPACGCGHACPHQRHTASVLARGLAIALPSGVQLWEHERFSWGCLTCTIGAVSRAWQGLIEMWHVRGRG